MPGKSVTPTTEKLSMEVAIASRVSWSVATWSGFDKDVANGGGGRTNVVLTTGRLPTMASGGKLGDMNAENPLASALTVRFPRISVVLKNRHTSGMFVVPASMIEAITLRSASLRDRASGSCEPVRITGLLRPSRKKESAEAVHDMVSVPWRITKPS